MKLSFFQVDAFSEQVFGGNPAGVCPLDSWLSEEQMQAIAAENNLAETAFFLKNDQGYDLRWFTPKMEVDLCGHATLGSAHVLYSHLGYQDPQIHFATRSGTLTVWQEGPFLLMDFPADPGAACSPEANALIEKAIGTKPIQTRKAQYYLAEVASEAVVRSLTPDFQAISQLDRIGLIVTARGEEVDFVSRFFAPRAGILEDPVTGSAHCVLTPYWGEKLKKNQMEARQLSPRGGQVGCKWLQDRVHLRGQAVTYLQGTIEV